MPPSRTKETRRRELLNAAIECFGARGYHSTQISDIIARAKVARGTFYLYFESKREIFNAVMTELFEKVQGEIRAIPKDAVEEIPSQIMGNIRRVTRLLMMNRLHTKILMSEAVGLDAELDERLRAFYGKILDYIRRGLKQGQEMGFVRDGNIQVLATCLLGSLKEVFYQNILGTEEFSEDAIVSEIYQLVIGAVAHPFVRAELERQASHLKSASSHAKNS